MPGPQFLLSRSSCCSLSIEPAGNWVSVGWLPALREVSSLSFFVSTAKLSAHRAGFLWPRGSDCLWLRPCSCCSKWRLQDGDQASTFPPKIYLFFSFSLFLSSLILQIFTPLRLLGIYDSLFVGSFTAQPLYTTQMVVSSRTLKWHVRHDKRWTIY